MKKVFIFLLSIFLGFSAVGCGKNKNSILEIPEKQNSNASSPFYSPINTENLDSYMFRDDVQYVDLRSPESIYSEGYIAGFQFISFYAIIASFGDHDTLYRMETINDENGNRIYAGQVGGFIPQFEQSSSIVESLFSKDKKIFLVSQGGSESSYMINLLIQLGYDSSKLYNVGGVINSEGLPSYSSIETNKYFVIGHGNLHLEANYDFLTNLTPIY